jgi:hypothetical protein
MSQSAQSPHRYCSRLANCCWVFISARRLYGDIRSDRLARHHTGMGILFGAGPLSRRRIHASLTHAVSVQCPRRRSAISAPNPNSSRLGGLVKEHWGIPLRRRERHRQNAAAGYVRRCWARTTKSYRLRVWCSASRQLMELGATYWSRASPAWLPGLCRWRPVSTSPCTHRQTPNKPISIWSAGNSKPMARASTRSWRNLCHSRTRSFAGETGRAAVNGP